MIRAKLSAPPVVRPPDPVEETDRTRSWSLPLDPSTDHLISPISPISKGPRRRWAMLALVMVVLITPGALIGVALVVLGKRVLHWRAE